MGLFVWEGSAVLEYGMVCMLCGIVWFGMVWYCVVRYGVVLYGIVWYGVYAGSTVRGVWVPSYPRH